MKTQPTDADLAEMFCTPATLALALHATDMELEELAVKEFGREASPWGSVVACYNILQTYRAAG